MSVHVDAVAKRCIVGADGEHAKQVRCFGLRYVCCSLRLERLPVGRGEGLNALFFYINSIGMTQWLIAVLQYVHLCKKIKKPKADRYEYIGSSQIPHSYLPAPSIRTWFLTGHGLAWLGCKPIDLDQSQQLGLRTKFW